MRINKYGLGRKIPKDVALKIRQDAGFGCVECGKGIIHYEHIEPEFCEAKEHNPENMTLLCPSCHDKVTRKIWSKERIWLAKKNPFCKQKGFSNEWFDFSPERTPYIQFGGVKTTECNIPLKVRDINILEIKPPDNKNMPFLLSGVFFDDTGKISLVINDNEWRAEVDNWDMTFEGQILSIKSPSQKEVLRIKVDPPNGLIIEKLDMIIYGDVIKIFADKIQMNSNTISGGSISNSYIGISIG